MFSAFYLLLKYVYNEIRPYYPRHILQNHSKTSKAFAFDIGKHKHTLPQHHQKQKQKQKRGYLSHGSLSTRWGCSLSDMHAGLSLHIAVGMGHGSNMQCVAFVCIKT